MSQNKKLLKALVNDLLCGVTSFLISSYFSGKYDENRFQIRKRNRTELNFQGEMFYENENSNHIYSQCLDLSR